MATILGRDGGGGRCFSNGMLFVTFWLAEAARVIDPQAFEIQTWKVIHHTVTLKLQCLMDRLHLKIYNLSALNRCKMELRADSKTEYHRMQCTTYEDWNEMIGARKAESTKTKTTTKSGPVQKKCVFRVRLRRVWTFSRHVAFLLVAADITACDVHWTKAQRLMFISCSTWKNLGCFNFYTCCAKSVGWGKPFSLCENRCKVPQGSN